MAKVRVSVDTSGLDAFRDALERGATEAEKEVAKQAMKDTHRYVPMRNGVLAGSARVEGNVITYGGKDAPYARVLWYGMRMVDKKTGKGPGLFIDENGNEVIRFRQGQVLKASDKPLKISRSKNPKAKAQWFLASKRDHRPKWERLAEEEMVKHANKGK